MTLTTSVKEEIDKQDEQIKAAQKRQEIELLKKNAELAERVAKLETRLPELEVAAQKKSSGKQTSSLAATI
jgi:hypothetical protein